MNLFPKREPISHWAVLDNSTRGEMGCTGYSMLIKRSSKEQKFALTTQMAEDVGLRGQRLTVVRARYGVSAPTLRRYVRAYQSGDEDGLRDRRQGPHHPAGKTSRKIEEQILAARERAPFMGGARLIATYQLPVSGNTDNRILREHGRLARPTKVKERRKDTRAVKALLKSLHKLEANIKYLTDIPNLAAGIKLSEFPKYQYTA